MTVENALRLNLFYSPSRTWGIVDVREFIVDADFFAVSDDYNVVRKRRSRRLFHRRVRVRLHHDALFQESQCGTVSHWDTSRASFRQFSTVEALHVFRTGRIEATVASFIFSRPDPRPHFNLIVHGLQYVTCRQS